MCSRADNKTMNTNQEPSPALAVTPGSASDFPAIAAMHLLTETAQRAARAISFQHTSMVFTLGEIKAAITLLESGRAAAALEVLKRAHAHGCEEMDSGPFPLPNTPDSATEGRSPKVVL